MQKLNDILFLDKHMHDMFAYNDMLLCFVIAEPQTMVGIKQMPYTTSF